jgi:hypothetical protein
MILTDQEQTLLKNKLFPLGKIPYYNNGQLSLTDTPTRRFILESLHVKKTVRPPTLQDTNKIDLGYLSFGIFESISVLIQDDYSLYEKLFNFFNNVDQIVSSLISSYLHAVVIFSHSSFGDRLFPHIHQDSGKDLKSLSLFFKLTNNSNEIPVLTLLDNIGTDSKFFKKGYTDHKLLLLHEKKSTAKDKIQISNNMCILFDADRIPHTLSYTNDIWVTVVYDHVTSVCNLTDKGRYHVGTI